MARDCFHRLKQTAGYNNLSFFGLRGAPFRGRRAGSAGELPVAWIEEELKPAFNVHGSGRELTRQSLVSLDDIK